MTNNKFILKILPFLSWFKNYNLDFLKSDFISGITVALVLIPQSMAYAQLANLPAYYGLYAAFLPPMIAALFGSSRQLATGPVAIVSLMTATALEPIAISGSEMFITYAILLGFIIGMIQFILGIFRLGLLVNFLSHPVVNGFTNAAALIIASSQLQKLFGVNIEKAEHTYETVYRIFLAALTDTHLPTLGLAILSFLIMYIIKKYNPRIPYVLIAVIITTLISWQTHFEKKFIVDINNITCPIAKNLLIKYNTLFDELDSISQKRIILNKSLKQLSEKPLKYRIIKELDLKHEIEIANFNIENIKNELKELKNRINGMNYKKLITYDKTINFCNTANISPNQKYEDDNWKIKIKFAKIDLHKIHFTGGGEVVGSIPKGLPQFEPPKFEISVILQLIPMAIIISLLGFLEAISIAKAMAAKTKQQLDPNQELIGQGLANIIGSLFKSYPVSGSFSRSAVNIQSGAITGMSSIFTSLVVMITLLYFTPLLYYLPQSVLASIIIMAVIGLINISGFVHSWKAQKYDGIISISTFILTLYFAPHLDKGIMIGVLASLIWFLIRNTKPQIALLSKHSDGTYRNQERFGLEQCKYIAVIRYNGSLFFANESYLDKVITNLMENMKDLRHIILVGNGINELDASGENLLSDLIDRIRMQGLDISITGLNDHVIDTLKRTFLYQKIGEDNLFRNLTMAIEHLHPLYHNEGEEEPCPLLEVVYKKNK